MITQMKRIKKTVKVISYSFIYTIVFILIFLIFFTLYMCYFDNLYKDKILPNVYVDNINFGGSKKEDVEKYYQNKNSLFKKTNLYLNYKNETATFSGTILNIKYDEKLLSNHAFSIGRSTSFFTAIYQKIKSFLNIGKFYFPSTITYEEKPISEYLENIDDKYSVPAEDALFKFEKGKVTAFKQEKNGLEIKIDDTKFLMEKEIFNLKNNFKEKINITIVDKIIAPEITLEKSNSFGIVEKVGEGKSDYSGSIPERIHNVILAASKFNGVLIPKNEVFSFNKYIGDISGATGYKKAYIIKNGKTVLGDGGGVCQISTTVFRAALNTGLPIIERWAHAYRVHYYENDMKPGFDSTVFDPSNDLKFKNDLPSSLLIQTEINKEKNLVYIYFYGKRDGRKAEISDATLWDIFPAPPNQYQDDPTLKKGIIKQVDWAAIGTKSKFHYKVTDKNNKTIIDQDFYSNYRPWAAVYLRGISD